MTFIALFFVIVCYQVLSSKTGYGKRFSHSIQDTNFLLLTLKHRKTAEFRGKQTVATSYLNIADNFFSLFLAAIFFSSFWSNYFPLWMHT